ncbi:MAG TPA: FHA domain-containing serine/threonine-protein kinase [Polyangiaceae bacterium]|nr:FHA domain-containing serine/threonine-protein kinase [Polyangiaceae bacterium]
MPGDEIPWDLPQVGDELAGQYEILGLIATGGTGILLRARQKSLKRPVVVKFMIQVTQEPTSAERFLRETRAAGRISEPHVANILDCGFAAQGAGERDWVRAETGIPFIVMEYMRGLDLAAMMAERNAPLEIPETLSYMREACIGVAAIHRQGTVLRDLKPANLFLCATDSGRNVIKVTDFGISKSAATDRGASEPRLSTKDGSLGSVAYMSPEQISQPTTVGFASDIWSLGVICYELLTRSLPFEGENVPAILGQILTQSPRPLRERRHNVPNDLVRLVARCLQRSPVDRYSSVEELAQAFEQVHGRHSLVPIMLKGPEPDTDHQIPRPGDWVLRFLTGKYADSERGLRLGQTLEIGRNSDLDLVLVEEMVSRLHARLTVSQSGVVLENLSSTNGTFVNGFQVRDKTTLKENDRVLIGTSIMKLTKNTGLHTGKLG